MSTRTKLFIAGGIAIGLVTLIAIDVTRSTDRPVALTSNVSATAKSLPQSDPVRDTPVVTETPTRPRAERAVRIPQPELDIRDEAPAVSEESPSQMLVWTSDTPNRNNTLTATPPPSPAPSPVDYVVQPGDSLWKISEKVYGDPHLYLKIAEANPGLDPLALKQGQKLVIPSKPEPVATPIRAAVASEVPSNTTAHQVKPGDSLWKIASQYARGRKIPDVIQEIVRVNSEKLASTDTVLQPGWLLAIP